MNSRRNFLKHAGLGLGAAITGAPFSTKAAKSKGNLCKVGILLSTSSEHPDYPESFMNGINLAFNKLSSEKLTFESVTELVKFGYPSQAIKKTQKLVMANGIDFIVGLLGTEVAHYINEVTLTSKIPTLIANAGENYPTTGMVNNPNLFFELGILSITKKSVNWGNLTIIIWSNNLKA
ncbi:MAG: twin-arginine translocation signal domain-containing protein [Draconibacterium sp.]